MWSENEQDISVLPKAYFQGYKWNTDLQHLYISSKGMVVVFWTVKMFGLFEGILIFFHADMQM